MYKTAFSAIYINIKTVSPDKLEKNYKFVILGRKTLTKGDNVAKIQSG